MPVKSFVFNPLATNCYIISSSGIGAIIDPSCKSQDEIDQLLEFVAAQNLEIHHLLLTHAHLDHIFGCRAIAKAFGLEWKLHKADWALLEHAPVQAQMFGMPFDTPDPPGDALAEGDQITLGEATLDVLHTPGHSPGSVSFVNRSDSYVVAGDVLFQGSIGRTDLWQGSLPILMDSIFQKLVPLGPDFTVYSGHGPETTIGIETQTNPFLTEDGGFTL